ncbi:MAG TPA: alcohol dehydrogenase catalytic domain-containing protein [Candidatus Nitrosotalea sp.]|nr:alcohol dehydrogenase catalytic domain-containing protein [Candidatus Nitrosotalea sp.]
MRALSIRTWAGQLEPMDKPEPVPADGEVAIQVLACGVGMTVLNCIRGDLGQDPSHLPLTPGHELVGRISAVGPGVDPRRVGELVTAYFYLFCGACSRCLAGQEDLCLELSGYLGVDRDGGYAERTVLPARNAIALPRGADPVLSTAVPDAISTPVHVAHRAQLGPGRRVVVIGAGGGVGVHMVQVARVFGAEVLGLDVSPDKLDFLERELGVRAEDSSDLGRIPASATWGSDGGPDVVVDFIGSPATLTWSLSSLAPGGRLLTLTTFRDVALEVSPRELVLREISVLGSRYATRSELSLAAGLVASGAVTPIVGRREGPDRVLQIHDDLAAGRLLGRGALVW